MKNYLVKATIWRGIIITLLLLMGLLILGFGISCYSQAPSSAPGPGTPETTPTTLSSAPATEITIEGFAFKPATLNVPVGTTVTWHNNDSVSHTVTSQDNLFNSGSLSRGGTFSYPFGQKGAFAYYCQIHPSMTGKVIVGEEGAASAEEEAVTEEDKGSDY